MRNNMYIKLNVLLISVILLVACQKEGLVRYIGGNSVGFWVHSVNHSLYGNTVDELARDTLVLDLAITGVPVDYDRYVEGTFIPDKEGIGLEKQNNTAVEGRDYNILGGIIKANEEYGKFKVEIINTDYLKDHELKLNLCIKENDYFVAGLRENRSVIITFSQKIMQPYTWDAMRFFFCATYSTQVYKVFMQATGLKEFYYFEGLVSEEEGYVMGRNFGNIVRAYEKEHGTPMLHDDGPAAGTPIIPIN